MSLAAHAHSPVRVLIVDDAAESRIALQRALSLDSRIQVVGEAGSGPEAVEQADALRPDVILMDVRMPGGDGIEATRSVSQRLPETNVVALTARDDARTVRDMLAAGATGYVVKGASIDALLSAVLSASEGDGQLDERVMPHALQDFRRLLREERDRRVEVERLARVREEFVHVLAHELRSPLTVIGGTLKFFERTGVNGEAGDLVGSAIRRAGELEHLIEGLELIGEGMPSHPRANPTPAIQDVSRRLGIRLDGIYVADEDWHGVPQRQLARVLHELVDNAISHGRRPVEVRAYRRGNEGVLQVRDAGDFDPAPDVFEAFTQRDMSTTREQGGLGLGLFVASRLCEAAGARLEIRREERQTVAEARFPLSDPVA